MTTSRVVLCCKLFAVEGSRLPPPSAARAHRQNTFTPRPPRRHAADVPAEVGARRGARRVLFSSIPGAEGSSSPASLGAAAKVCSFEPRLSVSTTVYVVGPRSFKNTRTCRLRAYTAATLNLKRRANDCGRCGRRTEALSHADVRAGQHPAAGRPPACGTVVGSHQCSTAAVAARFGPRGRANGRQILNSTTFFPRGWGSKSEEAQLKVLTRSLLDHVYYTQTMCIR